MHTLVSLHRLPVYNIRAFVHMHPYVDLHIHYVHMFIRYGVSLSETWTTRQCKPQKYKRRHYSDYVNDETQTSQFNSWIISIALPSRKSRLREGYSSRKIRKHTG